jgi:phosphoserine phosphatase
LIEKIEDEARTSAYPFALERLEYQAEHSHPVIFSLSPAFMVKAFARGLGTVRHARGTYFHTQSNVFSGHRKTLEKVTAVRRYQREKSLPVLSFAAGDTVHDLGVLNRAESCLVVNPGEELTEIAESKNWEIIRT